MVPSPTPLVFGIDPYTMNLHPRGTFDNLESKNFEDKFDCMVLRVI